MQENNILKFSLMLMIALTGFSLQAQEILPKEEAVKIAMENNFDIRISNNNVDVAENNASIQNSRYLPSVVGNAGGNYSNSGGTVTYTQGGEQSFENNETKTLNASLGLNYTIFDGFGRSNTYKKLHENYHISELQARQIVENTILGIFNSYYEVARLTQDVENQKESLTISRERLKRANYNSDYGRGSHLDILNAEVDYNNDSITYLTNTQLLSNEKRNLNLLLGRDVTIEFEVDTQLVYAENLMLDILVVHAKDNNVTLLQQEGALKNAEFDIKTNQSSALPKLSLNANYGLNHGVFGATSFVDNSLSHGSNLGATLSWNIYDGGSTQIKKQNSRIALENQTISLAKEKLNIERNLSNAWTVYQTALFIRDAQQKNVETAQTNFEYSVDQYKLGQITSIEFRQAQLNLLQAQLQLNQAKFSAKNAELFLLQISGDLKQATF
tara:strand:+ start:9081 stop:10409 length:1329 start_codon:yes stop_codon:yes gene_type:complete